jgi:phosphoribosylformylglycinamidine cyclo-ligase
VGVDIAEISKIHSTIESILSNTFQTRKGKPGGVLGIRQHYAGLIEISKDYALALHADGVGTKVLVAEACRKYDTIGIDCVAMNVNDVICVGAEPLALVNYLALEKARPKLVRDIMLGLKKGAREASVAIVSGETAIMSDVIRGFDLAATVLGLVRKDKIITGSDISRGDLIFGLRSSGIHSNGLTLARKLLLPKKTNSRIAVELLQPTRIYVNQVMRLLRSRAQIHGLAHITGGGYSKLKRLGRRAKVGFVLDHMPKPQWVFDEIRTKGDLSEFEMYRTFNMGIGFLIVCPETSTKQLKALIPELMQVGYVDSSRSVVISIAGVETELDKW